MANYAPRIVDEIFGGVRKMARDLSVDGRNYPPTTIQSWKDKGLIPAQHHEWVLQRGLALGYAISPPDFFDPPSSSEQRQEGAAA